MAADLFPGFESRWFDGSAGRIFARIGGAGPLVVLLHGFPQTHACWRLVAPALARRYTVVAPDLRGYGWSAAPRGGPETYAKRAMAEDVIAICEAMGEATCRLAGHDRGARVGYRLALDHPGRVTHLALLDILPTAHVWRLIEAGRIPAAHWAALSRPSPEPEDEILADPVAFMETLLAKWSKSGDLRPFGRAIESYRQSFNEPSRIRAFCDDYRAGVSIDRAEDEADLAAGRTIAAPTLVLWGDFYLTAAGPDVLAVWRESFAPGATGRMLDAGHFLAEEAPAETADALLAFFAEPA